MFLEVVEIKTPFTKPQLSIQTRKTWVENIETINSLLREFYLGSVLIEEIPIIVSHYYMCNGSMLYGYKVAPHNDHNVDTIFCIGCHCIPLKFGDNRCNSMQDVLLRIANAQ